MSEYRSIGEVLAVLELEFPDITISKIRFLESQGLLHPARTPAGYRQFAEADVEQLRWVLTQQRDHFLPLRILRDRINSGEWEPEANPGGSFGVGLPPLPDALPSGLVDESREPDPVESPRSVAHTALDLSARKGKHGIEAVARQANLDTVQVRELAHYGIIEPVENDPAPLFDDDAIVIAKAASAFMDHGVEPRHLKAWRTSADREASLFEQLTVPLLRQGSEGSRSQAIATAAELVELGGQLRYALLRRALRTSLGRVASA